MNVKEFYSKISALDVELESYRGRSRNYDLFIDDFRMNRRFDSYEEVDNQIFEWIFNYEMSDSFLGHYEFYKEIYEIGVYHVFGYYSETLFCIDTRNSEIVLVDEDTIQDDNPHVWLYCAKNDHMFFDAIYLIYKYRIFTDFDDSIQQDLDIKRNYIIKSIRQCSMSAGGDKYIDFFIDSFGASEYFVK